MAVRGMKILFVTPYLPSPPYFGAQRRLDGLMRGLAAEHEVSLLSFVAADAHTERSLEVSRSFCREFDVIRHDVLNLSGHLVFKGDKLQKVALCRSDPFAPEVAECLTRLLTELH